MRLVPHLLLLRPLALSDTIVGVRKLLRMHPDFVLLCLIYCRAAKIGGAISGHKSRMKNLSFEGDRRYRDLLGFLFPTAVPFVEGHQIFFREAHQTMDRFCYSVACRFPPNLHYASP
jgi:hypothetical protein